MSVLGNSFISIHAPTRGATLDRNSKTSLLTNFNPRSHKGSDVNFRTRRKIYSNFNPRSHKGSDTTDTGGVHMSNISIHAPTRGATIYIAKVYADLVHFNPRSHKGSDGATFNFRYDSAISIHAPTRGATL